MERKIIDFIRKKGRYYVKINNDINLNLIYDILLNDSNIQQKPDENISWDTFVLFYCGVRCDFSGDYDCMIKYYLMAINKGDCESMFM
jgi:hypothetical protein